MTGKIKKNIYSTLIGNGYEWQWTNNKWGWKPKSQTNKNSLPRKEFNYNVEENEVNLDGYLTSSNNLVVDTANGIKGNKRTFS